MKDIIDSLKIIPNLIGCGVIVYYGSKFIFNKINTVIRNRKNKKEKHDRIEVYEKYYMVDKEKAHESVKNLLMRKIKYRSYFKNLDTDETTDYTYTITENSTENTITDNISEILDSNCSINRVDLNSILKNIRRNHVDNLVKLQEKAKEMSENGK